MVNVVRAVSPNIAAAVPLTAAVNDGPTLIAYSWDGTGTASPLSLYAGPSNDAYELTGALESIDFGTPKSLVHITATLTISQPISATQWLVFGHDTGFTAGGTNGLWMTKTDDDGDVVYRLASLPRRTETAAIGGSILSGTRTEEIDPAGIGTSISFSGITAFTTSGATSFTFAFQLGIRNEREDEGPPSEANWHGTIIATTIFGTTP